MRKVTLRYCGALSGPLGPLLLHGCNDGQQVCENHSGYFRTELLFND
jgi:hypothetical protein